MAPPQASEAGQLADSFGLGIFLGESSQASIASPDLPPAPRLQPAQALISPPGSLRPLASPLVYANTPNPSFQLPSFGDFVEQAPPYATPRASVVNHLSADEHVTPRATALGVARPHPSASASATYGGSGEIQELTAQLAGMHPLDPAVSGRFLPRALTPDEIDGRETFQAFVKSLHAWLGDMNAYDTQRRIFDVVAEPLFRLAKHNTSGAQRTLMLVDTFVKNQLPPAFFDRAPQFDATLSHVSDWLPNLCDCSTFRLGLFETVAPQMYQAAYRTARTQASGEARPDDVANQHAAHEWSALAYSLARLSESALRETAWLVQTAQSRPDLEDQLLYNNAQVRNLWHVGRIVSVAQRIAPSLHSHLLQLVCNFVASTNPFVPFDAINLTGYAEALLPSFDMRFMNQPSA